MVHWSNFKIFLSRIIECSIKMNGYASMALIFRYLRMCKLVIVDIEKKRYGMSHQVSKIFMCSKFKILVY